MKVKMQIVAAVAAAFLAVALPSTSHAQAPAPAAVDLQKMFAKFECEQLSVRYAHYFDTDEGDKLADLFGDTGVLNMRIAVLNGGAKVAEFAKARYKEMVSGKYAEDRGHRHAPVYGHHTITNYEFNLIDADHATARAYLTLFIYENNGTLKADSVAPYMIGVFDDKYVRSPKGWRFEERKLTSYSSGFMATAPDPKK